jgi:hypothetical protein
MILIKMIKLIKCKFNQMSMQIVRIIKTMIMDMVMIINILSNLEI